jgi:hypothetical protein
MQASDLLRAISYMKEQAWQRETNVDGWTDCWMVRLKLRG